MKIEFLSITSLHYFPCELNLTQDLSKSQLTSSSPTERKIFFQYFHIVLTFILIEPSWVTSQSSSQSLWMGKDYSVCPGLGHNTTPEALVHLYWMDWKYAGHGSNSKENWYFFIRRRKDKIYTSKNSTSQLQKATIILILQTSKLKVRKFKWQVEIFQLVKHKANIPAKDSQGNHKTIVYL